MLPAHKLALALRSHAELLGSSDPETAQLICEAADKLEQWPEWTPERAFGLAMDLIRLLNLGGDLLD